MNLTIKQENESPLLSRKEIKAEAVFDKATPSNDDVAKDIAAKVKKDASLVVVKHIYTRFGETVADIEAYVYDSKEALEKIERVRKAKKGGKKEGEAAEGEAPAAAPAAAPAEKPKEEKKEGAE